MPVNSVHVDYLAGLPDWLGARDVLAGEDAVKAVGGAGRVEDEERGFYAKEAMKS